MRFALVLTLLLAALPVSAQDAPETAPESTPRLESRDAAVDPTVLGLRGLDAERRAFLRDLRVSRARAMEAAVEANRAAVEALVERLATAVLPSERLAVEREIERVKFEGDLELMAIQADHARRGGFEDVAVTLEAEITTLRERRAAVVRDADPVQD